jgi:hypothetical protein
MYGTLYDFEILIKFEFARLNFRNIRISNLMKIRLVEAELFHAGEQTGRTDGRTERHDEVRSRWLLATLRARLTIRKQIMLHETTKKVDEAS